MGSKHKSRRQFVAGTLALGAAGVLGAGEKERFNLEKSLVHHVFFWLKNPESIEDRNQLIEGLQSLAVIPQIQAMHLGVPASTEKREVVDNSFSVSEIFYFEDAQAQDEYQVHPVHKAFVENYAHLWERVVVYDVKAL